MIHKRGDGTVIASAGPFTVCVYYVWPYSRGVTVILQQRLRGLWWLPKRRARVAATLVTLIRAHLGVPDDILYVVNHRLRKLNKDVIKELEKIAHVEVG